MKLARGSFTSLNRRKMLDDDGVEIGEVQISRRDGWRGGPSYRFYPNAEGEKRGHQDRIASSIAKLVEKKKEAA